MKIGIVGAGQVGATAAYSMMMRRVGSEIMLVDRNADLALAQARHILDAATFSSPSRRHRLERLPRENCPVFCRRLIAPHDHIGIERIELDATADAAGLVDCHGRAGTEEWVNDRRHDIPVV